MKRYEIGFVAGLVASGMGYIWVEFCPYTVESFIIYFIVLVIVLMIFRMIANRISD